MECTEIISFVAVRASKQSGALHQPLCKRVAVSQTLQTQRQ